MFMHVPKMSCSAMRPSFAVAPVVFCFGALALLIPVAARADEQPGSPALQAACAEVGSNVHIAPAVMW